MAEPFEDITVARFEAAPEDQDQDHQSLFHFQFILSRQALELWLRLAEESLGDSQQHNPFLGRRAWVYRDRIVVRCLADDAQGIKDALNEHVLPDINRRYRSEEESAGLHPRSRDDQQQAILGDVERAVRDQT
jgi:hypothetical protein